MTKRSFLRLNTQPAPGETFNQTRAFWMAVIFMIIAMSSLGAVGYLAVTHPYWQIYTMVVISAASAVIDIVTLVLVRRDRVGLAAKLMYWPGIFILPTNSLLVPGVVYFMVPLQLAIGFAVVYLLYPRSWRRFATLPPIAAALFMLLVEYINPPFRYQLSVLPTASFLGPSLLAMLLIGMIVMLVHQVWLGKIRIKLIASFTVVALATVIVVGTVSYLNFRNQILADVRQRLLNIVSIAAVGQNGDLHAKIQSAQDMQSNVYQQLHDANEKILATDPALQYLYTLRVNDNGEIYFVVDNGSAPGYVPIQTGVIYDDASAFLTARAATLDQPVVEPVPYTDKWGTFFSAYAPFYREDGTREGIIAVDIDVSEVLAIEKTTLNQILVVSLTTLVVVASVGYLLGTLYTEPLTNLALAAEKIAGGDFSARAQVVGRDEVGKLAVAFNNMTAQLQETLQGMEQRVADRTKALATSAEVSRRLSSATSPRQLAVDVVQEVQSAFNYYHAHIYFRDEATGDLVMAGGTGEAGAAMLASGHRVPKGRGLVGRAAEVNAPVLVPDVSKEAGWLPNPLLPETKSEAALPISIGAEVLGVLDVQQDKVNGLTEDDVTLLQSIAGQVAISLQNAHSFEQSRAQAELETMVNTIGQQIQRAATVEETLQTAVRGLGMALRANRVKASLQAASEDKS